MAIYEAFGIALLTASLDRQGAGDSLRYSLYHHHDTDRWQGADKYYANDKLVIIAFIRTHIKRKFNFAKHQEIAEKLEISFYFCKPYHSWERGANENMNGLIRQYIPKGTDFSGITDEFVAWVEEKLNNRSRKRLGYLTPNEKFNLLLTN